MNFGMTMQPSPNWVKLTGMKYMLECEREDDGRFLAEVPQLPGVLAYGNTEDEAKARTEALALRVLAERLETGEANGRAFSFEFLVPA